MDSSKADRSTVGEVVRTSSGILIKDLSYFIIILVVRDNFHLHSLTFVFLIHFKVYDNT